MYSEKRFEFKVEKELYFAKQFFYLVMYFELSYLFAFMEIYK